MSKEGGQHMKLPESLGGQPQPEYITLALGYIPCQGYGTTCSQ